MFKKNWSTCKDVETWEWYNKAKKDTKKGTSEAINQYFDGLYHYLEIK